MRSLASSAEAAARSVMRRLRIGRRFDVPKIMDDGNSRLTLSSPDQKLPPWTGRGTGGIKGNIAQRLHTVVAKRPGRGRPGLLRVSLRGVLCDQQSVAGSQQIGTFSTTPRPKPVRTEKVSDRKGVRKIFLTPPAVPVESGPGAVRAGGQRAAGDVLRAVDLAQRRNGAVEPACEHGHRGVGRGRWGRGE